MEKNLESITGQGIKHSSALPEREKNTGLYTRESFQEFILPQRIKMSNENKKPLSYALIEVHGLQKIREDMGNAAEYEVFEYLANLLKNKFRAGYKPPSHNIEKRMIPEDLDSIDVSKEVADSEIVTYPDKFGLLLYNLDISKSAELVNQRFKEPSEIYRQNKNLNLKIGIAQYQLGLTPAELVQMADEALQQARENQGDSIVIYKEKKTTPPNPSNLSGLSSYFEKFRKFLARAVF